MSLDLCVCGHPLAHHNAMAPRFCLACEECVGFEPEDEIEASA